MCRCTTAQRTKWTSLLELVKVAPSYVWKGPGNGRWNSVIDVLWQAAIAKGLSSNKEVAVKVIGEKFSD